MVILARDGVGAASRPLAARRAKTEKSALSGARREAFSCRTVCVFGGHARGAGAGKGCAGLARRRGPARVFVKRRRRVRAARGVFSTRRRASGSSVYLRDARGARRELRASNGAAGASRAARWPRADSLLAATRCGRATEWLGLPPGGVISVARAGLDTGKRFSVGCLVLRGFLAVSSAIRSRVEITQERWLGVESWASGPTGAGGGCRRALFEGLIVCRRA